MEGEKDLLPKEFSQIKEDSRENADDYENFNFMTDRNLNKIEAANLKYSDALD
jgi:hypothetical protein